MALHTGEEVHNDDGRTRLTETETRCAFCDDNAVLGTLVLIDLRASEAVWRTFYDTNGAYHNHDARVTTGVFHCSRGHAGVLAFTAQPCRACEPGTARQVHWTLTRAD